MSVRKICQFKGCPYGDRRCSHPWWLDVMWQGVRYRMRVDEYAAPRGATAIIRTKEQAKEWLAKFKADIIEGRDPRVAPVHLEGQTVFTVSDCMDEYLKSHIPQLNRKRPRRVRSASCGHTWAPSRWLRSNIRGRSRTFAGRSRTGSRRPLTGIWLDCAICWGGRRRAG